MKTVFLKHRFLLVMGFCSLLFCLCACSRPLDLREAFDKVSAIDRFEMEEYESNRYGFPKSFGEAKVCIHPNSSCRKKVMGILSRIPKERLAFEVTVDEQIDRFYVASDSLNDNLLFAHIGQGSGDVVLILFSNVDLVKVKKLLSQLNRHHQSE